jgi:hypothetical protein
MAKKEDELFARLESLVAQMKQLSDQMLTIKAEAIGIIKKLGEKKKSKRLLKKQR